MTNKSLRFAGMALFWAFSLAAAFYFGHATGKDSSPSAKGQSGGAPSLMPDTASKIPRPGKGPDGAAPVVSPKSSPPPQGLDKIIFHARTSVVKGSANPLALRQLFRAIDQLKLAEMPAAVKRLSSSAMGQTPATRRMLLTALLTRWAELDGEAAANYIRDELANEPVAVTALSYVLEKWADGNFEAAYSWLQEQGAPGEAFLGGTPPDSSLFLAGIFKEMAAQNPAEAFDQLQEVPDPNDRKILLANMLLHTETDAERAAWLRRVDTLPEQTASDARDHLIRHLLTSDLDAAAGWISQMNDGAERGHYDKMLSDQWLRTDPARAAEWMLSQAAGLEQRQKAVTKAVSTWMNSDVNGAGNWLTKLGTSGETDPARDLFARKVSTEDPAVALEWASTITVSQVREQALADIYREWKRKNPDAAATGIENSSLTPAQIEKIRSEG